MPDRDRDTLFALDVETTTGNPQTAFIRELALVRLTWDFEPTLDRLVRRYSCQPEEQEQGAFDIHGIRPEEGSHPKHILRDVHEFVRPYTYDGSLYLLGHNIGSFDVPVLMRAMGPQYPFHYRLRDTLVLSHGLMDAGILPPLQGLTGLVHHFGLSRSELHGAEEDCLLEAEVYRRMVQRLRTTNILAEEAL